MAALGRATAIFAPLVHVRRAGRAARRPASWPALLAELAAQRGAAFSDAAVDRRVAGAGEPHDLLVGEPQALQVERFALGGLELVQGLEALAMLEAVEHQLLGAATLGVDRLGQLVLR